MLNEADKRTPEKFGITHEDYFRKYNLNVHQYGEILVALAYGGEKMPNNNKGYDVKATIGGKPAKIEVKSKFAVTKGGKATVLHCGLNKFASDGMTHLVVILLGLEEKGSVINAWLLSKNEAQKLARKNTKSQYINVGDLRTKAEKSQNAIRDIQRKLQRAAESCA